MEHNCREMGPAEEIALMDIEEDTKRQILNRVTRLEMKNEELAKMYDGLCKEARELETDRDIYRNALIQLCADFKKE